jgi:hypothetical protein
MVPRPRQSSRHHAVSTGSAPVGHRIAAGLFPTASMALTLMASTDLIAPVWSTMAAAKRPMAR